MLGKIVRSEKHLLSLLKDNTFTPCLLSNTYCYLVRIENIIYVMGDNFNYTSTRSIGFSQTILDKYSGFIAKIDKVLDENYWTMEEMCYSSYYQNCIVLPLDIESQITKCIQQNKKLLKAIIDDECYNEKSDDVVFAYACTNGNPRYMNWILNHLSKHHIHCSLFRRIFKFIEKDHNLISKLEKKNIIRYNTTSDLYQLIKEIHKLKREKRVNKVLNKFNTQQKKLLKEQPKTEQFLSAFSKFEQLSNLKQNNFIRKVSNIDNADEIISLLQYLIRTHFNWDKESVMDFLSNVEGLNMKVIDDTKDTLLISIGDYQTMKTMGKTTNWCISKRECYWRNTIVDPQRIQYMLFDFSLPEDAEYSIVGFTIQEGSKITNAHSFTNKDLLHPTRSPLHAISLFNYDCLTNIYNWLESKNIDINKLIMKTPIRWDKESVLDRLDEKLGDFYDIVHINNNKVIINTHNSNWKAVINNEELTNAQNSYAFKTTCVFLDFDLQDSDPNRAISFEYYESLDFEAVIAKAFNLNEMLVDVTFANMLKKFGAEHDIIPSTNTLQSQWVRLLYNNDYAGIDNFINEHINFIKTNKNEIPYRWFVEFLNYSSLKGLEILEKYNLTLNDLFTQDQQVSILKVLVSNASNVSEDLDILTFTDDDIQKYKITPYEGKMLDYEFRSVFSSWVLKKILPTINVFVLKKICCFMCWDIYRYGNVLIEHWGELCKALDKNIKKSILRECNQLFDTNPNKIKILELISV